MAGNLRHGEGLQADTAVATLRAIFFDIDDTLFSTSAFAARARRNAIQAMVLHGLQMEPEEALRELNEVIAEYRPAQVVIEKVFVNVNPSSTLLLGQARGTAVCAAVMHGLPVAEYTALQVKQSVVGNGHAQKRQVQEMVRRLLRLTGEPSADAADALADEDDHREQRDDEGDDRQGGDEVVRVREHGARRGASPSGQGGEGWSVR